jgi:glycosyltransferase involved in cell wall biosynthesis
LNHVAGVPVRVIPNGVSPNNNEGDDASRIEVVFRQCEPGPKILFLGRLHYKKGVDLLPSIMERVLKTHPNGTLLIAGPDQGGSRLKLERQFANSSVKSGN